MSISLDTIGALIDRGYGVTVTCLACQRVAELDLPAIAARHGASLVVVGPDTAFRRSLRCSACGSRRVQLTLCPPGTARGYR